MAPTPTHPTVTTERGRQVAYSESVIRDHLPEIDRALARARAFLETDYAEAQAVAARYARGPRTVATEGYAAKPGMVAEAQRQVTMAIDAIFYLQPYDALVAARAACDAYCGSGSMLALPEVLAEAKDAIWTAWRLALAAAR